ncbi:hypothetical protein M3Y97_00237200 [Aphelenchoides bicaudatus]|nr:hypothetical protein M3Y97_00237200 [Aphelenchoides bicaudatus]
MPGVHTFYDGSRLLEPISALTGVEYDMLNLVFCQFLSVPLALVYRLYFPPETTSKNVRLTFPLIFGLFFGYFCYGNAIKHPISLIIVSYSIMKIAPTKYVHKLVFCFAMSYLIFIHWYRWYILTSYAIDITGPMMVLTQKVTTMAFSLHDGRVKKVEELTEIQKREALAEVPSVLSYLSYLFCFQTILTGPLCFYADYRDYIDGSNLPTSEKDKKNLGIWNACIPKFAFALVCMAIVGFTNSKANPEQLAEPKMLALPAYQWWLMLDLISTIKRCQYYYAWVFADAVSNLSGFGFNGYDENHKPKWNLISNVNAWNVETSFSFKETLDNWNCTTMHWLRRVAYERVPQNYRTLSTYLLSAVWHGFFLGYYMTFLTGALVTLAGRATRRCFRHHFQTSYAMARFYDAITLICTRIFLDYTTFPFMTLHLNPGLFIYKRLYFSLHILAFFAAAVLPKILPSKPRSTSSLTNNDRKTQKTE